MPLVAFCVFPTSHIHQLQRWAYQLSAHTEILGLVIKIGVYMSALFSFFRVSYCYLVIVSTNFQVPILQWHQLLSSLHLYMLHEYCEIIKETVSDIRQLNKGMWSVSWHIKSEIHLRSKIPVYQELHLGSKFLKSLSCSQIALTLCQTIHAPSLKYNPFCMQKHLYSGKKN